MTTTPPHISIAMQLLTRYVVRVTATEDHRVAVYRVLRRRMTVVCTKRTGERWECVVTRMRATGDAEVLGIFVAGRLTDHNVTEGTRRVLTESLYSGRRSARLAA